MWKFDDVELRTGNEKFHENVSELTNRKSILILPFTMVFFMPTMCRKVFNSLVMVMKTVGNLYMTLYMKKKHHEDINTYRSRQTLLTNETYH